MKITLIDLAVKMHSLYYFSSKINDRFYFIFLLSMLQNIHTESLTYQITPN